MGRAASAPAGGRADRGQGHLRHRGRRDDLRLGDVPRPRPGRDAEAVRRVRAAGAIVLGKTATHEFAWGFSSINDAPRHGPQPARPRARGRRLQRRLGRRAGGRAGAAGARDRHRRLDPRPERVLRIYGLKPTWGRVSLDGVWPLARTLDHVGPMARSAAGPRAAARRARAGSARTSRGTPPRVGGLPRPARLPARAASSRRPTPSSPPALGAVEVRLPRGGADRARVPGDPARRGPRDAPRRRAVTRARGASTAPTCAAGSRWARESRCRSCSPRTPTARRSAPPSGGCSGGRRAAHARRADRPAADRGRARDRRAARGRARLHRAAGPRRAAGVRAPERDAAHRTARRRRRCWSPSPRRSSIAEDAKQRSRRYA